MTESDITIVRNTTNNSLRLIITSHDGRTIVSQNRKHPDVSWSDMYSL